MHTHLPSTVQRQQSIPQSTVLVVDDNLGARKSIEALLSHEGYRFLLADSGQAALDLLELNTPDIILLDVMMPGMSGFTVCQHIRSNPRISEIPILMITALDDEESMIQGIEAGADDFLPKPISKTELRARIRSILRLNRFRKICDERQKFEIVVTQSQLGYIVLDSQSRIQFLNDSAAKMLEIEPDPQGQPYFLEIAKTHYLIQPEESEDVILSGSYKSLPEPFLLVRSRSKTRPARWIRATLQKLGESSGPQRLLKLEDITDRIVSFQEKQTFSRMISHKLLTPLNAIKASHQMIKGAEKSPKRLSQIIDIQQKGIERLEYDVQSILSFLAHESKSPRQTRLIDTVELIKQIAKASHFPFTYECDDSMDDAALNISESAFEACLREIVENAIKFGDGDVPTIHAIVKPEVDRIEYQFLNNSKPLTEEEFENAWKPYWQADRYYTGEIKGMGLGLSLIAANVWTAGGTCKIQNCPEGKGVQLTLSFPCFR